MGGKVGGLCSLWVMALLTLSWPVGRIGLFRSFITFIVSSSLFITISCPGIVIMSFIDVRIFALLS